MYALVRRRDGLSAAVPLALPPFKPDAPRLCQVRLYGEGYVADRQIPVTEISYMLGFSDVSSFSRAYKRWTGSSPALSRHREDAPEEERRIAGAGSH